MSSDFVPRKEAQLVTFTGNFSTRIGNAPTEFGITVEQSAAYAVLSDSFVAAYQTASSPATRSPSNIVAKSLAKKSLVENLRMLARIIQANPAVDDQQKSELGLTVRSDEPTPTPPPATAPGFDVRSVNGRTVYGRLHDVANPSRRGKPDGVAGAAVFSYVGPTPPDDSDQWHFEGNFTRTLLEITFPDSVPAGSQVWLTAFWYNPRAQRGPGTPAVGVVLAGGAALAA